MEKNNDCIFCKIAQHETPADVVFENDNYIAFRDIKPEAPTHVLVIPKTHIEKMSDLKDERDEELVGLWKAVLEVVHKLGISDNAKLVVNNGRAAGQIVDHVHVHVLSQAKTE